MDEAVFPFNLLLEKGIGEHRTHGIGEHRTQGIGEDRQNTLHR